MTKQLRSVPSFLLLCCIVLTGIAGCGASASPTAQQVTDPAAPSASSPAAQQSAGLAEQLIGRWESDAGMSLEFFPTGVVIQTNADGRAFASTYALSDDGATLTSSSSSATSSSSVAISGDTLLVYGTGLQRAQAEPAAARPAAELLVGSWSGSGGRYLFAADGTWAYFTGPSQPRSGGRYSVSADGAQVDLMFGAETKQLSIEALTPRWLVFDNLLVFERQGIPPPETAPTVAPTSADPAFVPTAVLLTPTPDPQYHTQVVGNPLPAGTLEIDLCFAEGGCHAVVTEQPPGSDDFWCAVLERNGKLVPASYRRLTNGHPLGSTITIQQMRANGCSVAPTLLDGGEGTVATDTALTSATPAPTRTGSAVTSAGPMTPIAPVGVDASASAPAGVNACNEPVSYDPALAIDGRMETAWRVPGDGAGQFLRLDLAAPTLIGEVALVPGYAKVDPCDGVDRFAQNRRVRKVRLSFSDGSAIEGSFADEPTLQAVRFASVRTSWVQITILETYPQPAGAAGRDYTPISEVVISGNAP